MREYVSRWAAVALVVVLGIAVCAPPAAADTLASTPRKTSLTALSPASLQVLRAEKATTDASARAQQSGTGTGSGSFFGSTQGRLAIGLMAAGVAYTVWTIHDSRKPVKSPVR